VDLSRRSWLDDSGFLDESSIEAVRKFTKQLGKAIEA
jgi:hypothetical protein